MKVPTETAGSIEDRIEDYVVKDGSTVIGDAATQTDLLKSGVYDVTAIGAAAKKARRTGNRRSGKGKGSETMCSP